MTVDAIKDAIIHLSEADRTLLTAWLDELDAEAWDGELEEDLKPGGRADHLIKEAEADLAAGRTKPLEDFLAEAKERLGMSPTEK